MHKLKNGLEVILLKNPSSKVLSLQLWVNCGSVNEGLGEYGVSHFIEHLLFKGSNGFGLGEIAKEIEALGGELNAFTSLENTCYYINIPSFHKLQALKILHKLVFEPSFDETEINNERGVVIEEINRSADMPSRVLSDIFFKIHFDKHPYSLPVLGTKDVIANITKEQIIAYYKKHYIPNNSFLVLSGNTDDTILKDAEDIFEINNLMADPVKVVEEVAPSSKGVFKTKSMDVSDAYFICGFHIPNIHNDDIPALDVLSTILGDGESSKLYQLLRNNNLVNSIYSSSFTPKNGGVFNISFSLNAEENFEGNLQNIFQAISEIFLDIIFNGLKDKEINRAVTMILSEKIYEMETTEGIARRLAYIYSISKDLDFDNKYYDKLKKVNNSKIVEVIKKYFVKEDINISCVYPNKISFSDDILKNIYHNYFNSFEKIKPKKIKDKRISSNLKSIINYKAKAKIPELITFDNGLKLILAENKTCSLFSMKLGLCGGTRFENNETQGIYNLCSRSMLFGAGDLKYTDIIEKIDSTASSISAFSGKNSFGFSLECISSNTTEMLKILNKIIVSPSFEEQFLEAERLVIIDEIKSIEDNLSSFIGVLLLENVYKKHPYRFPTTGTIETVKSFDKSKLLDFYKNIISPKNMVLSAVGNFKKAELIAWAENFNAVQNLSDSKHIIEREPQQIEKRFLKKVKDCKQSHIALAYKTCNILDKAVNPLKLAYSVLAGQSGRLFMNLRDKKSLAYTVSPIMSLGVDEGYFGSYIACEHEKADEAISEMKRELNLLKTEKISDFELNRAKNYLIGRNVLGMQRYAEQAFTYTFDELYGLGFDYYKNYEARINSVSAEDIREAINQFVDDSKETMVLISNK